MDMLNILKQKILDLINKNEDKYTESIAYLLHKYGKMASKIKNTAIAKECYELYQKTQNGEKVTTEDLKKLAKKLLGEEEA